MQMNKIQKADLIYLQRTAKCLLEITSLINNPKFKRDDMKEAFKKDSEEQMADMYYYVKEWSITKLKELSGCLLYTSPSPRD